MPAPPVPSQRQPSYKALAPVPEVQEEVAPPPRSATSDSGESVVVVTKSREMQRRSTSKALAAAASDDDNVLPRRWFGDGSVVSHSTIISSIVLTFALFMFLDATQRMIQHLIEWGVSSALLRAVAYGGVAVLFFLSVVWVVMVDLDHRRLLNAMIRMNFVSAPARAAKPTSDGGGSDSGPTDDDADERAMP